MQQHHATARGRDALRLRTAARKAGSKRRRPAPDCRIRPATPADAARVVEMCRALSEHEALGVPTRFTARSFRRDGFGPDAAFNCLVAEMDGKAVGYALFCRDYDTDRLCRCVYVADLYVEKKARRWGIGRALMAAVGRVARKHGANMLMWTVERDNRLARRFYRGFSDEGDETVECGTAGAKFRKLAKPVHAPKGVTLRPAKAKDSALVARFLLAMLKEIGLPCPPDAARRIRAHGFGNNPSFTCVIAELEGKPIGFTISWITYDTEENCRGSWLSDLYVIPEARRLGVAQLLMSDLARRTKKQGGGFLVWLVHKHNRGARNFYRRMSEEWQGSIPCVSEGRRFSGLLRSSFRHRRRR